MHTSPEKAGIFLIKTIWSMGGNLTFQISVWPAFGYTKHTQFNQSCDLV